MFKYQRLNNAQWQVILFKRFTLWWDAGRGIWKFEDFRMYNGNSIALSTPKGTLYFTFKDMSI